MAPSRHDWKIVDWDVKPQHNQPTYPAFVQTFCVWLQILTVVFLIVITWLLLHLKKIVYQTEGTDNISKL